MKIKYGTNKHIYKTETDSETQRTDLWMPKGREKEWDGLGVWGQEMRTILFRMGKQYSTGNYI